MKIFFEKEEKLIFEILFFCNSLNCGSIDKIDFEKFVKIASSHQLLPAIYSNLLKNDSLKLIPSDLNRFLKEIYKLNKDRNLIMKNEIDEIKMILNNSKIPFAIVKGAKLINLESEYFSYERMIGDIDILIEKNNLKKSFNLLLNKGYSYKKPITQIWKKRHMPKLVNKNKVFAVELHKYLIRNERKYDLESDFFNNSNDHISTDLNIRYLILNDQINDYNYLNARINFKALYDFYCMKKNKINLNYFDNKYCKHFFLITNEIGITDLELEISVYNKLFIMRYNLKRKYALYLKLDRFICKIIELLPIRLIQLIEIFFNKEYRKYVMNRLK